MKILWIILPTSRCLEASMASSFTRWYVTHWAVRSPDTINQLTRVQRLEASGFQLQARIPKIVPIATPTFTVFHVFKATFNVGKELSKWTSSSAVGVVWTMGHFANVHNGPVPFWFKFITSTSIPAGVLIKHNLSDFLSIWIYVDRDTLPIISMTIIKDGYARSLPAIPEPVRVNRLSIATSVYFIEHWCISIEIINTSVVILRGRVVGITKISLFTVKFKNRKVSIGTGVSRSHQSKHQKDCKNLHRLILNLSCFTHQLIAIVVHHAAPFIKNCLQWKPECSQLIYGGKVRHRYKTQHDILLGWNLLKIN